MKSRRAKVTLILFTLILLSAIAVKIFYGNIEANLERLSGQTIKNIDLSKLADGMYNGSFKVFPIEAEVNVIIENQRIKQIVLVKHENGQGAAAEAITSKVIEAQALNVNAISGATYSSKVILKAIENALSRTN